MATLNDFAVGETLDNGRYRVVENLFGSGVDCTHIAVRSDGTPGLFLVSSTDRVAPTPSELTHALSYAAPGLFELVHIGAFDERGDDNAVRSFLAGHTVVLEALSPGMCIRQLVKGALSKLDAVRVGIGVGSILVAAARGGVVLAGVRPETIWATRDDDIARVTGLSDRGDRLFRSARAACFASMPTYERQYTAPEALKGDVPTERTLSFILATMLAEWLTGEHPFPDAWSRRVPVSVIQGNHAPLAVSADVEPLLLRSFSVEPGDRPSLVDFVGQLEIVARQHV